MPIITTGEAARKLRRKGFSGATPLQTWESHVLKKANATLKITSLPGRHGPGVLDRLLPDVMGSLLEFSDAGRVTKRIYITGDTLLFEALKEIPARFPDIDLALLHLGGTRIMGIMLTMDGRQGARAIEMVMPKEAVPIHYDDYAVFKSPLEDFQRAVDEAGLGGRVRYVQRGGRYPL